MLAEKYEKSGNSLETFKRISDYTPQPIESIDRVGHKLDQVESIEKIDRVDRKPGQVESIVVYSTRLWNIFSYYFFTKWQTLIWYNDVILCKHNYRMNLIWSSLQIMNLLALSYQWKL